MRFLMGFECDACPLKHEQHPAWGGERDPFLIAEITCTDISRGMRRKVEFQSHCVGTRV